jgi:hypothetical protein
MPGETSGDARLPSAGSISSPPSTVHSPKIRSGRLQETFTAWKINATIRTRSRAVSSRDDSPSRHPGVVLARILFFGVKNTSSCKLLEQKPRNFLSLLKCSSSRSVDGGPLTDNAVFVSAQRVLALKRTAALTFEIPISFISG